MLCAAEAARVGLPAVEGEGRLAVGARPGRRASASRARAGSARRKAATASRPRYQVGIGGIAMRGVVGEHGDQRVDVAALPGGDEARRRSRAARRRRARAAWPAGCARAAARRRVLWARCSALYDRGGRRLERVGRPRGPEKPEHVAQDQHGALARRQVLQRGDERQLDALALLVARLGPGDAVAEAQALVGVGLDPHRFDERRRGPVVGVGGGAVVDREHELGPPLDRLQARVGGDRVEPGAQRAAALEARQPAPGAQQRLLQRVLGVLDRAEHPVAVGVAARRDAARPAGRRRPRRPAGRHRAARARSCASAAPSAARTRSRRRRAWSRRCASPPGPRAARAAPRHRAGPRAR